MKRPIYLDYNGTTPHAPEVIDAMRPFLETSFGNPSSGHWYGVEPRKGVTGARMQVARLLGCDPGEIIFTSGGTESNNHALKTITEGYGCGRGRKHIISSVIEHPAVLEVCGYMAERGYDVTLLPVDEDGLVRVADVEAALRPETVMISIMHANNEIGTIQPVGDIGALARRKNILLHSDAAQSVGKITTRVDELEVDLLSIAGHKLYGPKGVGALYLKKSILCSPFCHGAGQEQGRRAGTENVLEIVGLGMACEVADKQLAGHGEHMKRMRNRLESGLSSALDNIRFNGHREKRLPNTCSVSFHGLQANDILHEIQQDVAASAGAACHADSVQISHVLQALGIGETWAMGTIRFSTGRFTTEEDIDRTLEVTVAAVKRLRGQ